jgi:small-conductance mechanosensitive channel
MAESAHIEMHVEHRHWASDQALWRDSQAIWEKEIDAAFVALRQAQTALEEHRQALGEHTKAIKAEERAAADHEHALAEFERSGVRGSGEELLRMSKLHKQRAERHVRLRDVNERLKQHQHRVMAQVGLLLHALGSAV